jgi:hypothetical protein
MKGIPTFRLKRLKRAAVLTGVGALIASASVLGALGATQAYAANPTTVLGNDAGDLGLSLTTGSTTAAITYSSNACPNGFQGSADLLLFDPLDQTDSTLLGSPVNGTAAAFTFTPTGNTTLGAAISGGFISNADGNTVEVVVECFQNAGSSGNHQYEQDAFLAISTDGSTFTKVSPPAGPPANVTVALTASPSPATAGQSVTLTATVLPAAATGTIQFENNGTNINTPVTISGGSASTSTTFSGITSATTETLTAVYTATGNFAATTPGSFSLTVNPAPANSGIIPLAVSVPQSGSFQLTVDSTDVVTLAATDLNASGATTPITVADSRNSYPGWSVSGQDSAWTGTGTAAGGTFSGDQLGWTPTDTALAPAVTLGSPVNPVTPGLGTTAATLASVHAGLGNGFGTSTLGANLALVIPPTAPAGPYTSGLTISAVTSNP